MQRQRQLSIRIYVPCCQSHSVSLRGGQLFPIVQLMTPQCLLLPIHPPSSPLSPPQFSFSIHNSFSQPNLFLSQLATTLAATTRTARWPRCTWGRRSWCSSGCATPAPPSSRCTSPTSSSTRTTPPSWSSGSLTSGMSLLDFAKFDIPVQRERGIIESLFLLAELGRIKCLDSKFTSNIWIFCPWH